jgi:hypothetical protein
LSELLDDPLIFVSAALQMANCEVETAASGLKPDGEKDFEFVFDIEIGIELSVLYTASTDRILVASSIKKQNIPAQVPELALQLNHLLPRHRRLSLEPAEGALVISDAFRRSGLALEDLALSITDLVELAVGLSKHEAGTPTAPLVDDNRDSVIIRS